MSDFGLSKNQTHDSLGQTKDDISNRGMDNRLEDDNIAPIRITLMTIDEIIINYFDNIIKPMIVVSNTVQRVPIIYGSSERWSMFREKGALRSPGTDKALTPMIMIRRNSVERGLLSNPVNKYLETAWESGWNRRNAYDKFAVLNGIRPSRKFHTIIVPDYVDITYDVVVWTEYEEQMSDLLSQIQVESEEYWGVRNNFKFRVKIDAIDSQTEIESTQDRLVRSAFTIKVNAYLIPERIIKNAKIISNTQNIYTAKKVVTMVEFDGTKK